MKFTLKKTLSRSAAAAAAALTGTLALTAAVGALTPADISPSGEIYYAPSVQLSDDLRYSELYSYDSTEDIHNRAYMLEYDYGSEITLPLVSCGGNVYGRKTLDTMISYKLRDSSRLAAAINADYFSMMTGVPMGLVIENDLVFTGPANKNAVVFTSDSRAFIDEIDITFSLTTASGQTQKLGYFNKYPTVYTTYLQTSFYGSSTTSTVPSREIVFQPLSGGGYIKHNDKVKATVVEVRDGVKDTAIPKGCFVLTYALDGYEGGNELLASLAVGDSVTITSECEALKGISVPLAFGGGDIILDGGEYDSALCDEDHEKIRNPRTAAGIKEDGTVVFYAVDGRRNGFSSGLTLAELAEEMRALGCTSAINLDGGGSTTVIVNLDGSISTVNRPTDGEQRKIASALLLVNSESYIARKKLDVTPRTSAVLTGSGADITVKYGGETIAADKLTFALSEGTDASVSGGRFTAGEKTGAVIINVSAIIGGETVGGSCEITVLDSLSSLTVAAGAVNVDAGESVKLSVYGYLYNAPVNVSVSALDWSGGGGSSSDGGVLTRNEYGYLAGDTFYVDPNAPSGEVTLTARRGSAVGSITLTVTAVEVKPEDIFADIGGHWAAENIALAYDRDYISGTDTDKGRFFYPDDNLTRAQLAKICCTFSGIDMTAVKRHTYTDADVIPAWALDYIDAAVGAGLMNGRATDADGAITFDPNTAVTRAEAMQVLGKMLDGSFAYTLDIFADEADIPAWARDMVGAMVSSGIVGGYSDGTLRPGRTVSRAELCKMLIAVDSYNGSAAASAPVEENAETQATEQTAADGV